MIPSRVAHISSFPRINAPSAINKVSAFLWTNKIWVIGALAIGVIIWMAVNYFRRRPQYPNVEMKSTLNCARITVEKPYKEPLPANVDLVLCVDTSSSMQGDRENQVKTGVNNILDDALQQTITKGAQISIAIIGFNQNPRSILPLTKINNQNMNMIKQSLDYQSDGTTKIIAGLEAATAELESTASKNTEASRTLVLLTDGEDNISADAVANIHNRLAAVKAKLFAIGIGESHNKVTLNTIVNGRGFQGEYIDTTSGDNTIVGAISQIYHRAIAVFSDLELQTSQLGAGTWSMGNTISQDAGNGKSKCLLGNLSEGHKVEKGIRIHPETLQAPFDLSTLSFEFSFTDPKGRKGIMSLPWKPDSKIDPQIYNAAMNN